MRTGHCQHDTEAVHSGKGRPLSRWTETATCQPWQHIMNAIVAQGMIQSPQAHDQTRRLQDRLDLEARHLYL